MGVLFWEDRCQYPILIDLPGYPNFFYCWFCACTRFTQEHILFFQLFQDILSLSPQDQNDEANANFFCLAFRHSVSSGASQAEPYGVAGPAWAGTPRQLVPTPEEEGKCPKLPLGKAQRPSAKTPQWNNILTRIHRPQVPARHPQAPQTPSPHGQSISACCQLLIQSFNCLRSVALQPFTPLVPTLILTAGCQVFKQLIAAAENVQFWGNDQKTMFSRRNEASVTTQSFLCFLFDFYFWRFFFQNPKARRTFEVCSHGDVGCLYFTL